MWRARTRHNTTPRGVHARRAKLTTWRHDDAPCLGGLVGALGAPRVASLSLLLPAALLRECATDSRAVACQRVALLELQLLSRTRRLLFSQPSST